MNGLGFMIWQLANMLAPAALADKLKAGGVRWACIKVLDGPTLYNAKGGNQKLLKEYWAALKAAGVEPGGWQYVYGDQPGAEGDAASAFYEEFDPSFFFVDAEGEYKRYGTAKAAKAYSAKLHTKNFDVYLCSYRFPTLHGGLIKPFPFSAFMNHENIDGTAPQVYWLGAHDPVAQIQRSQAEYRAISSKPFIPIGATFPWGDWEPSKDELQTFVAYCKTQHYQAYGFYSLDSLLKNNRQDWWEAITGNAAPPPPPPPPPDEPTDHEKVTRLWAYAASQGWEV